MNTGRIYVSGEIGVECTLLDVIKQAKSQPAADSFIVKIDSNGGYVDAGMDIYNYLRNLGKPITTITSRAYSIASVIFMAGDTRIIPEGANEALMIHLPWIESVSGNQEQMTAYAKTLKDTEDNLVKFYSTVLDIHSDAVHSLLKSETFLSATEALEMGFATSLQVAAPAVAKLNNKSETQDSLMNKLEKKIDSLMKFVGIKSELRLQDATGIEIVFPDLADSDVPAIGDKATIDGKPAEGEFTMPDTSLMTFITGAVTEIESAQEETTEDDIEQTETADAAETPDDKDAKIAELEAKIAELEAKLGEAANSADVENLVDTLRATAEKYSELEAKHQALAKQVGSDFSPTPKDTIIAKAPEYTSRAAQILNSKFTK